ncbi:hypothetical protein AAFF_G00027600 [Aldrovandia affinis]|uniref:Uncharacterized protein n=1 Tax=Aldrovandia affinis TaxID=143900 RepID=A0AAD7WG92_9TELE|nr:hypothetical protein AAFF_G00027600 [Aldrovandia affinis]
MALNVELQQRQTEQEKLLAQRDDFSSQLQEVNRANSRLLEQLTELGQEKDKLQQELEETRKTADKRKAMLDELAIDVAQAQGGAERRGCSTRRRCWAGALREGAARPAGGQEPHRGGDPLTAPRQKARTRELESLQQTVEELQAQIQSMEGTKGWFKRRLKEAEETAEKSALEHQEQIQKLQLEQTAQLQGKMAEIEAQQRATENSFQEVLKVQTETVLDLQDRLKGQVWLHLHPSTLMLDHKNSV